MPNYWVVRAGDDIQGEVESRSLIGIGWQDVGDFGALSLEQLKQKIFEAYPHQSPNKRGSIVGQLHRFRGIDVGDIVLTPIKSTRQILIGRVTGPYRHDPQPERDRLANTRNVEWIRTDVFRDDVTLLLKNSLGGLMTVFSVNSHAVEIAHLIGATPTDSQSEAVIGGPSVSADADSAADIAPTDAASSEEIESKATERIRDLLYERFDGYEFEGVVGDVLKAMGFTVRGHGPGPDRGVDLVVTPDALGLEQPRIKVQVKRVRGSIGGPHVRQLAWNVAARREGAVCLLGGLYVGCPDRERPDHELAQRGRFHSALARKLRSTLP